MAVPYLVADSAQVTVLRSLASTAFGKYGLKLPEGVDLEDVYEVAAPGNELAYVSSLGGNRRVGGMFRRFVRADVNITAQGEDMVPASDVERVLDEAAKRVSGDFFLESDISKAGLGPWVPFVDFHVGDIANVEIWGRVVPLAVTRIEPKRTDHSDEDWSVHVGGQLLSDSEARLAENAEIYNAVVSDRRELAGLDGKIRAETENRKSAISAESQARESAIASESRRSDAYADAAVSGVESRLSRDFAASYERYSKALTELGDTWRQELQDGLSAEQQARVEALRQEQKAREKAGTDLRGQLEKALDDAVADERRARQSAIEGEAQARSLAVSNEARARQKAISDLSTSFTTELQTYGELVKEAKNYVDPATQQVVNFWSKENQNNFNKAVQLTLAAQSAYNDINNIKWVSNDAWQAQQEKINEARSKFEAQQIEIDAAQDEVAKANRKASDAAKQAADAAKQAADTASDLATKNGILLAKIKQLQGELDKRAAGSITAFADENRWSAIHKKAIEMPKSSRWLVVYAEPSFKGTITVLVNYSNGNTQTYWARGADMDTVSTGSVSSVFAQTCGKDGVLKKKGFVIALGSVGSATMIFDNVEWS
ncbi:hypothetical protein [Corynebacterium kefirresidentii]|uniref:hypothetical protein n=1 Tax=Corynebacterium kefirresidentii TaxID=1979527 RepID=UPI003735534D